MLYNTNFWAEENVGEFDESLVVCQILPMSHDINKESKQAGIYQSFTHLKFLMRNSPKFSFAKNSHYTPLH